MIIEKIFNINEEKDIREVIENMPMVGCAKKFTKYVLTNVNAPENKEMSDLEKRLITKLRNDINKIYTQLHTDTIFSKMNEAQKIKELQRMLQEEGGCLENEDLDYLLERFEEYNDSEIHGFIKQTMSDKLDAVIEEATRTEDEKNILCLKSQFKSNDVAIENYKRYIKETTDKNLVIADRLKKEFDIEV